MALQPVAGPLVSAMCAATRGNIEDYETYVNRVLEALRQVQAERRDLAGRVHVIEDELTGSVAANQAMKATLQQTEKENGQLKEALQEQTTQHHGVRAALEIAQREAQQAQISLTEQEARLTMALRRVASKERLDTKVEERRALEGELQKVQGEIEAQKSVITNGVALACGIGTALLLAWWVGLMIGLGGRQLLVYLGIDYAICPWLTPLYASQASLQGQLRLVNEEITRLRT